MVLICTKTCGTCRKAVAMLNEAGVAFTYREYTKDPLSAAEIRTVLGQLDLRASDVLRKRDANKAGLTGDETDEELIARMVDNPRLLQRPILVSGARAALGRPVENLAALLQ